MNKVRRGDFPSDLPVTGMPANLRGGKCMAPVTNKGPTKDKTGMGSKPRRELGPQDGAESKPRRDFDSNYGMATPETDE